MKRRVALAILDGWGIGKKNSTNPLHTNPPVFINSLKARYGIGALQSSGIAVGLPWGEEGNSEVGHLTLGSGKIVYQHYPRISLAIRSGTFFKSEAIAEIAAHVKNNNSALHLVGTLSQGNVHASLEHLEALLDAAKRLDIQNVYLHLFSDGKDSPPKSLKTLLAKVEEFIGHLGVGKLSSVSGRYFALDRDEHWDRTQAAYKALTGSARVVEDLGVAIDALYAQNLTDEYFEPALIGKDARAIKSGDSVIFFDFREDSIRQLAGSFLLKDFDKFPRVDFKDVSIATITRYSDRFDAPVISPSETIVNPLGKVLSDKGLTQLRIAETEKYAHVTYFFNGYRDVPFENEYRVLVPSKNIARPDEDPEMRAKEISARFIEGVTGGGFDLIVANFANADIIAHTGNYEAAVEAVKVLDAEIEKISAACLERDVVLFITSDHGNVEVMTNPLTGQPETKHNATLVPFIAVGRGLEHPKDERMIDKIEAEAMGLLSDVAPTILEFLEIPRPPEMSGQSVSTLLR